MIQHEPPHHEGEAVIGEKVSSLDPVAEGANQLQYPYGGAPRVSLSGMTAVP